MLYLNNTKPLTPRLLILVSSTQDSFGLQHLSDKHLPSLCSISPKPRCASTHLSFSPLLRDPINRLNTARPQTVQRLVRHSLFSISTEPEFITTPDSSAQSHCRCCLSALAVQIHKLHFRHRDADSCNLPSSRDTSVIYWLHCLLGHSITLRRIWS